MNPLDQMHPFGIAIAILGICLFFAIALVVLVHWGIKHTSKQESEKWQKQHPDLALIALPVVYVQPYENGVMIQDSKSRLHYFTDRGYRWEPLENIEI
ncbi:hypothetical protein [Phaeodactylibacter sp.]|uniref:hypothetical protein n=1 Tax=Phaeodactylibacter sp. TaxID=1940289 RepID=UPI0025CF8C34|nr:hypothetical protein [Phaeodactylibacter sp.]MCI4650831.1 hypothetical protein [Phaeodactylibacter sp.]MCI5089788.1 hypothetical protein [Phaeodactylibacter sp.]